MGRRTRRGMKEGCKTQGTISTIPTKYQTVVITNEEKMGFSSQTKRFLDSNQSENPGPGSYLCHTDAETRSTSFSKKGTGGLASQASREPWNPQRGIPGPNAYNLQSSLVQSRFSQGESRTFRLPIAEERVKNLTPAPNHYNVCYRGVEKCTIVSAKSAFLSRTGRHNVCSNTFKGPSPCQYSVRDAVTQRAPRVPFSCFKTGPARIQPPAVSCGPGPGAYSPYHPPEPARRTILPRRHYLGLAAPPLPIVKDPPLPGPGHYELVDYDGPPKHVMSSAAFVSGTSRWTQGGSGHSAPGPGSYDPEVTLKRSFLHNCTKRWIPT